MPKPTFASAPGLLERGLHNNYARVFRMGTASSDDIDLASLRTWIGREAEITDQLTPDLARRFCATFDQDDARVQTGEPAPRLIHFCLAQPAAPMRALGIDGHPDRGAFLPPTPLPRRMWASGSVRFFGDLLIGDLVRRVSRIADVSLKSGTSGPLCFVSVEHLIDVAGTVRVAETQTLVYRGTGAITGRKQEADAGAGDRRKQVDPSATLLFRYSALTFNGHRIHYDRSYAEEVEGYPGLVVHGPLQASLLYRFAAEINGHPPDAFAFRSQSPLFDTEPFLLNARPTGDGLSLWTARRGGPLAMTAEASWT